LRKISTWERVLPRGRVEHEERVVRRVRVLLADHADDLGKFLHQVLPVLEAARRVDHEEVGAVRLGLRHRVEGEGGGVGAFGRGQDRHARASPQTWSCSTAAARKVSPAAITTVLPAARNWLASLPIVVVLPEPFTPTTSTTCGFFG
jgi:hypothetical protein